MATTAIITIEENSRTKSTCSFPLVAGTVAADINAVATAIEGVTYGAIKRVAISADTGFTPSVALAPIVAQRGQKWVVRGLGADGKIYQTSIATANPSEITNQGSDILDIAVGTGAALKGALDAVWADATGGAVVVQQIIYHNYTLQ